MPGKQLQQAFPICASPPQQPTMTQLRFSELSVARQDFVRECQRMPFGKIVGLLVRDAEPVFNTQTEVLIDIKLDADESARPEVQLPDFTICAELERLFANFDVIRNGSIENIEVRAGVPRRIIFQCRRSVSR